ncbi:MAG TPA: glycosyltransferase family 39 protein, partial [Opitutaceae bacterium]
MPPALSFFLRSLPLLLITLGAFWLRTHDLGRRPMHADEANQAVKLGELLEAGSYAFDPRDHHGPTLYYAAVPIAWIRGQRSLAGLQETTVRLVPALFGTAAVLLLAALAAPLGRWPALAAAAFLAVSPPAVYYSRYFIQETLLATFTLAAIVCARAWWRSGLARWAVLTGVCVGLMQATKASAPLFLAIALAAFFL